MSFRLFAGDIDSTTFSLKPDAEDSPTTGIKIDRTITTSYENTEEPSVFRFTVLNSDAKLTKIEYDFFNHKEDDEEGSGEETEFIYTELDLDAKDSDSTDEISKYTINLDKNWDNISLKLEKSNENAVVKINEEEMDVANSKELVLNQLGEEDTVIDIIVTAQDKTTTHTYRIVIHKPYGTIKGSIRYDTIEDYENPEIIKITDLNFYETGKFAWEELLDIFGEIYEEPATYDDLDLLEKDFYAQSKEDGTYEVYIMPGTYDLQIDKRGFLDKIITNIPVNEGDLIDLDEITLIAGDVDRDRSYRT